MHSEFIKYHVYRRELLYLKRITDALDRLAARAELVDKTRHERDKKKRKH